MYVRLWVTSIIINMSVSFSFTKKSSNKPLVRAEDSLDETKDYVVSVEGKQIQR